MFAFVNVETLKLDTFHHKMSPQSHSSAMMISQHLFKSWEHLVFQVSIKIQLRVIQIHAEEFLHLLNTPESGNIFWVEGEFKNYCFAVQTLPYLLYCSSEDCLSIFLMVLPVLYNSDTCKDYDI